MKDRSFIGIRSTRWFQNVKIFFIILDVNGKKNNELLNKKPNKNDDIVINENGAIICNKNIVSNKFNNYFVNVAQNFLRELNEPSNQYQDSKRS